MMRGSRKLLVLFILLAGGCHRSTSENDDVGGKSGPKDASAFDGSGTDLDADADSDSDSDSDTDSDTDTDTDSDSDSDTDPCADASVPDCVRYVNVKADIGGDGLTWETAFTEIQQGIDSAYEQTKDGGPSICEVWVAKGTYRIYKDGPADTIQLRSGIELYGGFSGSELLLCERNIQNNETILTGCLDTNNCGVDDNQVFHVIIINTDSLINGFSIIGGNSSEDITFNNGAGILIKDGYLEISEISFIQNNGYAVALHEGSLFASECFFRNTSSGIIVYDGDISLDSCYFSGSSIAVFLSYGNAYISNSVFYNNKCYSGGCAIYNANNTLLNITNSSFVFNDAIYQGEQPPPETAAIRGGGATIYNSIFWGNGPDDLLQQLGSKGYKVYNTLIGDQQFESNNNNFFEDPEFVLIDEYSADLHLKETSPCIDRADDSKAPERDFDGNKRVDIPGIGTAKADVGAYEYVP